MNVVFHDIVMYYVVVIMIYVNMSKTNVQWGKKKIKLNWTEWND